MTDTDHASSASGDRSIEVSHLVKTFGAFKAVNDVSFHVEKGEIFGYLGANGAGKSTTIRMLCGLLAPTSGQAIVAGHDIAKSPEGVKRSIGYMSQKFSLYLDLTVEQNLEFFGGIYGAWGKELRMRIDRALEEVSMRELRTTLTGSLPGGLRQRLALGSSLLHRPSIVFLDEPTAGVDPSSRRDFWRLIRRLAQGGTTVFVTTHYMDEAEYCARIGLMVAGKLVALDTPAELKRTLVPGRTIRIEGDGVTKALPVLRAHAGVIGAEGFGAGLHVRIDPARMRDEEVGALVAAEGARVTLAEQVEPTLEDVFIAAADAGAEAAIRGKAA
jgi:ABC-2 type transport system ATP-binding protein